MIVGLGIKDINNALDNMVEDLCCEYGEQLISIVVYGSYARETATQWSDIDLIIVVKVLPKDWQSVHCLEDEWMLKGRRLGKRFQITLVTPEDVSDSIEYATPMMLEIHNNHKIIFDRCDFFKDCMKRMEYIVRERGIRMRKPGVWEVPEHVTPS